MKNKTIKKVIIILTIISLYAVTQLWVNPALFPTRYKEIDSNQNTRIQNTIGVSYNKRKNLYTLNSPGGNSDAFYARALEIRNHNAPVQVLGVCMSACSEYLLMVATKIKFINRPMIGFHGNPVANDKLGNSVAPDTERKCITATRDKFSKLQQEAGVPDSFNDYQVQAIGVEKIVATGKIQDCPTSSIKFKNYMWLATSEQLRTQMNLTFTGGTCADDYEMCTKRVNQRWDKGTRIVIGDKVYVSKGHKK